MVALIAVLSSLAYLAAGWSCARWQYRRLRPYTEPLSCTTGLSCSARYNGKHYDSCYRRPGTMVDTAREAAGFAFLTGAIWPAIALTFGSTALLIAAMRKTDRPLPEETAAKTERLERELGIRDR